MTDRGYDYGRWWEWVRPDIRKESIRTAQTRFENVALEALAQAALLRDFMLLADHVGHPANRPDFLWHLEGQGDDTDSLSGFFNGKIPWADVASFAIAQHHGIPTGLLDWTYNPLVAAFFASERYADPAFAATGAYLSVWGVRTQIFRHPSAEIQRITVTPGRVPFLDAQNGLFTWNPNAFREIAISGKYPPLDQVIKRLAVDGRFPSSVDLPLVRELRLPVSEGPALLSLLWREKITRAHLMPTFDNVAESLRMRVRLQTPWVDQPI